LLGRTPTPAHGDQRRHAGPVRLRLDRQQQQRDPVGATLDISAASASANVTDLVGDSSSFVTLGSNILIDHLTGSDTFAGVIQDVPAAA